MNFTKNIGSTDKYLRIGAGVILLILALINPSTNWWGFLGIIPLATAFLNFCPVYTFLKINTSDKEKK
jgi:hypothetical protein